MYFSYSGNYGATPLGAVTADGKPLPPQSAQQYEFGVKTEWLHRRLSATTSIYQITKQNIPSLEGLRFQGAPTNSGSLWSVYEVPGRKLKGLRFGAGVVGRTREVAYESPDGVTFLTDRIPGFAIVNAMTAYTWHWERTTLSAQLNINNLLNHRYFSAVNPSKAMPGAPIIVMPAIRVDF